VLIQQRTGQMQSYHELKKSNVDKQKQVQLHSRTLSFKLKLNLLQYKQVYISNTNVFSRWKNATLVVAAAVVHYFTYSRRILFARHVAYQAGLQPLYQHVGLFQNLSFVFNFGLSPTFPLIFFYSCADLLLL
jgi:hypothetical protein